MRKMDKERKCWHGYLFGVTQAGVFRKGPRALEKKGQIILWDKYIFSQSGCPDIGSTFIYKITRFYYWLLVCVHALRGFVNISQGVWNQFGIELSKQDTEVSDKHFINIICYAS